MYDEIGMRDFAWQEGYGAFTVAPYNAKRFVITSSNTTSTIARAHFARNVWNCYADQARIRRTLRLIYDCPCWGFMFLLSVVFTTG